MSKVSVLCPECGQVIVVDEQLFIAHVRECSICGQHAGFMVPASPAMQALFMVGGRDAVRAVTKLDRGSYGFGPWMPMMVARLTRPT